MKASNKVKAVAITIVAGAVSAYAVCMTTSYITCLASGSVIAQGPVFPATTCSQWKEFSNFTAYDTSCRTSSPAMGYFPAESGKMDCAGGAMVNIGTKTHTVYAYSLIGCLVGTSTIMFHSITCPTGTLSGDDCAN